MVVVVHQCKQATPLSGAVWHPSINNTTAVSPTFMICGQSGNTSLILIQVWCLPYRYMAKCARPNLLFSQMKTPDVSYGCHGALLETSHVRTLHSDKEGKGGGIMGKKLCDTLKPGCCSDYCLIWGKRLLCIAVVVNMKCVVLTVALLRVKYYYWTSKSMTSTVSTPIEDKPSYTDGLKDI